MTQTRRPPAAGGTETADAETTRARAAGAETARTEHSGAPAAGAETAGGADAAAAGIVRELVGRGPQTVVLVEGTSDRVALETLAARRQRNLDAEGVCVVPMGGAMSIGRFVALFTTLAPHIALRGLCDTGEERYFRRAVERAGLGADLTRATMESLGFYVCEADLEDELIRALGAAAVERVVDAEGDLRRLRTFRNQPAQRGRSVERQLRRFMGTLSGRKARYARALVRELDPARTPRPLDLLLAAV